MHVILHCPAREYVVLPDFEWSGSKLPLSSEFDMYNAERKIGVLVAYLSPEVFESINQMYVARGGLMQKKSTQEWVDVYIADNWFPLILGEKLTRYIESDADVVHIYCNYNVLRHRITQLDLGSVPLDDAMARFDEMVRNLIAAYPFVESYTFDAIAGTADMAFWSGRTVQVV